MPRRLLAFALVFVLVFVLVGVDVLGLAAYADAAPPLVVFYGPPRAPTEVTAARDAVARVAADAGAAFIDLSAAPAAAPTAATQIARAIESYDALRADEAQAALDDALAEVRASGGAGLGPSQLSDLFLYRGLVLVQKGDPARAWDDLVRAVVVDATRVLDPARFPPKSVQAVQRAIAQVRLQPTGRLAIAAPPGCTTSVDARPVTLPPELPYGEHFVRVECPGERPQGGTIVLGSARQSVEIARPATATPSDEALFALAGERGAKSLLVVAVSVSAGGPPTARLRLRELPSGTLAGESSAALPTGGDGVAATRAAAERLVARAAGPLAALTTSAPAPASPARWYQRPWLWGLVGVGVAAAVLVPFAVDRGGSSPTLTVHPGPAWPQ